jgi:hypothetical protein
MTEVTDRGDVAAEGGAAVDRAAPEGGAAVGGAAASVIAEKDSSAAPISAPTPEARRAVISRDMVFRSAWWAVSMKAN